MKDSIAERMLAELMCWEAEELKEHAAKLQALAVLKYDEYEQYKPGIKFAEHLVIWLRQFEEGREREDALQFIEKNLLFITNRELNHIIRLAYPDWVKIEIRNAVAEQLSLSSWDVSHIVASTDFKIALRRSLFLGLSDGARLDRFRRASPELSHEQFAQEYEVADRSVERMTEELQKALRALGSNDRLIFNKVWLIDDFAGSGHTLIRPHVTPEGEFNGKLPKFKRRLERLAKQSLVEADASVNVLLYIASSQATDHVKSTLEEAKLDWQLHVIHKIPSKSCVQESTAFAKLCHKYYDPSTKDEHKSETQLGYSGCALPLVISHNTPNNSVCLLWAETGTESPARNRRALFPRYERHHKDRQ
ncbi:MAG: hypothetical protein OXI96_09245 [Acidimicrobiaceae bacterium]|nr:hypothetical protein [Acidimicrobiaceae bacterium]